MHLTPTPQKHNINDTSIFYLPFKAKVRAIDNLNNNINFNNLYLSLFVSDKTESIKNNSGGYINYKWCGYDESIVYVDKTEQNSTTPKYIPEYTEEGQLLNNEPIEGMPFGTDQYWINSNFYFKNLPNRGFILNKTNLSLIYTLFTFKYNTNKDNTKYIPTIIYSDKYENNRNGAYDKQIYLRDGSEVVFAPKYTLRRVVPAVLVSPEQDITKQQPYYVGTMLQVDTKLMKTKDYLQNKIEQNITDANITMYPLTNAIRVFAKCSNQNYRVEVLGYKFCAYTTNCYVPFYDEITCANAYYNQYGSGFTDGGRLTPNDSFYNTVGLYSVPLEEYVKGFSQVQPRDGSTSVSGFTYITNGFLNLEGATRMNSLDVPDRWGADIKQKAYSYRIENESNKITLTSTKQQLGPICQITPHKNDYPINYNKTTKEWNDGEYVAVLCRIYEQKNGNWEVIFPCTKDNDNGKYGYTMVKFNIDYTKQPDNILDNNKEVGYGIKKYINNIGITYDIILDFYKQNNGAGDIDPYPYNPINLSDPKVEVNPKYNGTVKGLDYSVASIKLKGKHYTVPNIGKTDGDNDTVDKGLLN